MFMILQKLLKEIESLNPVGKLDNCLSDGKKQVNIGGLSASSKAMVVAHVFRKLLRPMLVISTESETAERMADDLKAFLGDGLVYLFPALGISPYEIRAPHMEIVGQRLLALYNLSCGQPMVIIAPVEAILEKTIPKRDLSEYSLRLERGKELDREKLIALLERLNYQRSPMTEMLGEYSVRGGIIDFFAPKDEDPVRIEFFGDVIESIRHFSVLTQRSTSQVESTVILPRREIIFNDDIIERYAHTLDEAQAQALYITLGDNGDYDGLEFIWPNMGVNMANLFEHLSQQTLVFVDEPGLCDGQAESVFETAQKRYKSLYEKSDESYRLFAKPERIYLDRHMFDLELERFRVVNLTVSYDDERSDVVFHTRAQEYFSSNMSFVKGRLAELYQQGYKLNILCEGPSQKERIGELIDDLHFPIGLHVARLSSGFAITELKQWFLVGNQMFTRFRKRHYIKRFREGVALSSYTSLNPGDFVVHIDYGIGKFLGLETLVVDGRKRDCLALLYLGNDKLYVPIEQFNRVQKFAGKDGDPRLSKLGTGTWERVKARTKKALMAMAGELVELYAKRQAYPGFAFKPDTDWIHQLEASFEFQETPGQLKAMDEIKADMEKSIPMERLICGDVGYGKTELAIRAALKAVESYKQVAVLVPTTILAAQHLLTFKERLSQFPVKIEMYSRFCTPGQSKRIRKGLADGSTDIVIGTHKLLQKSVCFKELGLLIIDEEHRFGVGHKEKIKKLKTQVDVLTLTATPIPRTLQMSLIDVRDMSVINTPPKDRLPITTRVANFSDQIIVEAVERELDRGGQVFIVHNRVQSIWAFYRYLKELMPLVKIGVAHGQMPERELESVMNDFLNRKYMVLLSTTIIESGLDIPSVNTIIIIRADKLGLAQLYQLRGRVGRSHYRAYAYLLIPPLKLLTRQARKRLKAIEEFTELGSGFHLALRDLEIRGAGNLLGPQQHGFIEEVGFDLYVKLLEEAVAQFKGTPSEYLKVDVDITTDLDLFLPENYIPDNSQRVDIYRRFAGAESQKAVNELVEELVDRFGLPPESVDNLAQIAIIRLLGEKIGLSALQLKKDKLTLEFSSNKSINRKTIERWVSNVPERLDFKTGRNFNLQITIKIKDGNDRARQVKNILRKMVD
ncbi:MAG: transcription-repair coupling factor [candidate division Zixibacteria bacterium 4484_95]|nr:MAG: transcription-repair coupling factor [candidate division Zixibacteria bacterium 4484_95]